MEGTGTENRSPRRTEGNSDNSLRGEARISTMHAAAKKSNFPKLKEGDKVVVWLDQVEQYVRLQMDSHDVSSQKSWSTVAIANVDITGSDATVYELRSALDHYPYPMGMISVTVRLTDDELKEDPSVQEMKTRALRTSRVNTLVHETGFHYIPVSRPLMVWEWLHDFVFDVWLNDERKEHYANALHFLRFVPAVKQASLQSVMNSLSKHVRECLELFELGGIKGALEQKRYFRQTFSNDSDLVHQVTKAADFEDAHDRIKKHLTSRFINNTAGGSLANGHGGQVDAIQTDDANELRTVIAEMRNFMSGARNTTPQAGRQNQSGGRGPNQSSRGGGPQMQRQAHRQGRRGRARPYSGPPRAVAAPPPAGGPPGRVARVFRCYYCGMEGHAKAGCSLFVSGAPSPIPPCPEGVSLGRHVAQFVRNGAPAQPAAQ